MKTPIAVIAFVALIAFAFGYTAFVYPSLPAQIPTHWDLAFHPNAWTDKHSGAWLLPGTVVLMFALMLVLPRISPKQFQVEPFTNTFNAVTVMVGALFAYLQVVTLMGDLHPGMEAGKALASGFFFFFALMGNLLGKVRRNFWMGIRTPWTLASDRVWIATHRMAARLFVALGLFGAVAIWLGVSPGLCFTLLILGALLPALYSLAISQREG